MSIRTEKMKQLIDLMTNDERTEVMDYLIGLGDVEPADRMTQEEWETAWEEEINRRVADFESGKVKGIPMQEVLRRLDEKLK
jgi:putative addiction module component (TIGR02574 family)